MHQNAPSKVIHALGTTTSSRGSMVVLSQPKQPLELVLPTAAAPPPPPALSHTHFMHLNFTTPVYIYVRIYAILLYTYTHRVTACLCVASVLKCCCLISANFTADIHMIYHIIRLCIMQRLQRYAYTGTRSIHQYHGGGCCVALLL